MSSTVFDSGLYRDMFTTPAMRGVFSDRAQVARFIEVEVALAKAQGGLGVIPAEAAREIAARADLETIDFEQMKTETETVGYPILPLVHQLGKSCGEAGRYIHWGATTQDIMDSATVLQLRAAFDLVASDLAELRRTLTELARKHRDTPMAGRTHLQQALPITFGYKCAIWLAGLDRHTERLLQLRPRVEQVQFAGAAGTLASLGTRGLEVQAAMAKELKLAVPLATWHVARDGFAEAVQFLALLTGSLAKIAYDVMLMMATELGEVYEPFVKGRGASSTMPQKRNPISCEFILAAAKMVRQHAGAMLDAMVADLERATGPWHVEWAALPEAFLLTAGALHQSKFILGGLIVDAARMRRNLDLTGGLIVAEAVMMGLAPKLGRNTAHDVVYDAARKAAEGGLKLLDVLSANEQVAKAIDRAELAKLVEPLNYVGLAPEMVDRVLAGR